MRKFQKLFLFIVAGSLVPLFELLYFAPRLATLSEVIVSPRLSLQPHHLALLYALFTALTTLLVWVCYRRNGGGSGGLFGSRKRKQKKQSEQDPHHQDPHHRQQKSQGLPGMRKAAPLMTLTWLYYSFLAFLYVSIFTLLNQGPLFSPLIAVTQSVAANEAADDYVFNATTLHSHLSLDGEDLLTLLRAFGLSLFQVVQANKVLLVYLLFAYYHLCVLFQFCAISRCRMRSLPYRLFISWPATWFFTAMLLAFPMMPLFPLVLPSRSSLASSFFLSWFGLSFSIHPILCFGLSILPLALAAYGLCQTLHTRSLQNWKRVDLTLPHSSPASPPASPISSHSSPTSPARMSPSDPPSSTTLRSTEASQSDNNSNVIDRPKRCPKGPPPTNSLHRYRPLKIIIITDPHLGPIMSVQRLKGICQGAVDLRPDLILLTGDFLTAEAHGDTENILAAALKPLKSFAKQNRVFACLGNHDKEEAVVEEGVKAGLRRVHVRLLVDEEFRVKINDVMVQIVGLDYKSIRTRKDHIESVCKKFPPLYQRSSSSSSSSSSSPSSSSSSSSSDDKKSKSNREEESTSTNEQQEQELLEGASAYLRLLLLHDPGGFRHVPPEDGALVLSGHTHGGQFGFLSFGLNVTIVGAAGIPDNGFWSNGTNRLYVHRGQGCRSMMGTMVTRLGVPTEDSILTVFVPSVGNPTSLVRMAAATRQQ